MLKAFLKDSALYGTANMLARGIQILLVPFYTHTLLPEDYGVIDMMMLVGTIASSVLTLEISAGMARSYADADEGPDRASYTSTALWVTIGSALIVVAVAMLWPGAGHLMIGDMPSSVFRVAALAIAAQMVFGLLSVHLQYARRVIPFVVAILLLTVAQSGLGVILVLWAKLGVIGVFYGQVAGYVLACAVAGFAARGALRSRFDRARFREMVSYSAPLVLSAIGSHLLLLGDRVIIDIKLGLDDVGIYGIGARISGTVSLLLAGFSSALGPLIYSRYKEPETPGHLARMLRMLLVLVLPMLGGLSIFSEEIVWVIAPPAYKEAATVIPILTLAAIIGACANFAPGLALARKTRVIAVIMLFTALENVVLNFALIPSMGVRGAAVATLISSATPLTIALIASQRLYPAPHRWGWLLAALAVTVLGWVCSFAVDRTTLGLGLDLAFKAAIWLAASTASALMLLDRHDLALMRERVRRFFKR